MDIDKTLSISDNIKNQVKFNDEFIIQLANAFDKPYDEVKRVIDKYVTLGHITKTKGDYVPNMRRVALGVKAHDKRLSIRKSTFAKDNYRINKPTPRSEP